MLVSKTAPSRCFTQVSSSLARQYLTRLERLARDKRSSLLWKVVIYGRKKFYNIGHRSTHVFPFLIEHVANPPASCRELRASQFKISSNVPLSNKSESLYSCRFCSYKCKNTAYLFRHVGKYHAEKSSGRSENGAGSGKKMASGETLNGSRRNSSPAFGRNSDERRDSAQKENLWQCYKPFYFLRHSTNGAFV
jgi:hypothetical protein